MTRPDAGRGDAEGDAEGEEDEEGCWGRGMLRRDAGRGTLRGGAEGAGDPLGGSPAARGTEPCDGNGLVLGSRDGCSERPGTRRYRHELLEGY